MAKDPNVDQAAIQRAEAERLRRLAKEAKIKKGK